MTRQSGGVEDSRREALTIALVVAIAVHESNLNTAIEQLSKNRKIVAFQKVACSFELASDGGREASKVERHTEIFLHSRVVEVSGCPSWGKRMNERRSDVEVESLVMQSCVNKAS